MKMIHIVGVDWDSVFCVYVTTVHPSQSYLLGMIKILSKLMVSQFLEKSMRLVSLGNPQPLRLRTLRWPKRNQLRWNIGLLTGYCQHEDHLLKL
jgi:hypothetical protein